MYDNTTLPESVRESNRDGIDSMTVEELREQVFSLRNTVSIMDCELVNITEARNVAARSGYYPEDLAESRRMIDTLRTEWTLAEQRGQIAVERATAAEAKAQEALADLEHTAATRDDVRAKYEAQLNIRRSEKRALVEWITEHYAEFDDGDVLKALAEMFGVEDECTRTVTYEMTVKGEAEVPLWADNEAVQGALDVEVEADADGIEVTDTEITDCTVSDKE